MASAFTSPAPPPRASARLLNLAFALGVATFFWAFVAGLAYLLSVHGGLPLRTDPLTGARQRAARGDIAGAVRQYRIATLIEPTDLRGLNEMGELLVRAGRYDESIAAFEKVLHAKPDGRALAGIGTVRALQGDFDRAIAAFEAALAIAPDSPARANLQRVRAEKERLQAVAKAER